MMMIICLYLFWNQDVGWKEMNFYNSRVSFVILTKYCLTISFFIQASTALASGAIIRILRLTMPISSSYFKKSTLALKLPSYFDLIKLTTIRNSAFLLLWPISEPINAIAPFAELFVMKFIFGFWFITFSIIFLQHQVGVKIFSSTQRILQVDRPMEISLICMYSLLSICYRLRTKKCVNGLKMTYFYDQNYEYLEMARPVVENMVICVFLF